MIGDNETKFPHELLLTNRQVSNLRKVFANHLSADIKLSKTHLSASAADVGIHKKNTRIRKSSFFLCFAYNTNNIK